MLPPPAGPRDTPRQPAVLPPSLSYADVIHAGTSEFDPAVGASTAPRRGIGKGKKSPPATTASKVASLLEAALPKGPPPLTSARRRFYAARKVPAPHPEGDLINIGWPDWAASVLTDANSRLPLSFEV